MTFDTLRHSPYGSDPSPLAKAKHPEAEAPTTPEGHTLTPFTLRPSHEIEPRRWLYGHHISVGMVSATVAPGGTGKSALATTEVLSMVTGRDLIGVRPARPLKVLYWNGEDPADEIERRFVAACLHYEIETEDLGGRLFVLSGRDVDPVLAKRDGSTVITTKSLEILEAHMRENGIDVAVLDPLSSFHELPESDNDFMKILMKQLAMVAHRTNSGIETLHHTRKGAGANGETSADDARGAGAVIQAVRSARTLTAMTPEEASKAGITDNRRRYVRIDNAKANLAPPPERSHWFQFQSEPLGNHREDRPGDEVGVAVKWEWPNAFDGVTVDTLREVQAAIGASEWRKDPQANNWAGKAVASIIRANLDDPADLARTKTLLATWLKNGALKIEDRVNAKGKSQPFVIPGEPAI